MKKLIYIGQCHLTERVEKDWYISKFIDNGYEVEYWDISYIMRGEYLEPNELFRKYVIKIYSIRDFEMMVINNSKQANFIVLMLHEPSNIKIFRSLKRGRAKIYSIMWGGTPERKNSLLNNIFYKFRQERNYRAAANKLIFKIYMHLGMLQRFFCTFTAGNYFYTSKIYTNKKKIINLIDYEKNNINSIKSIKSKKSYAVFLDNNLPSHPDLKLHNLPYLDKESYYKSLEDFFKEVELITQLKVIFAAHPTFSNEDKIYINRKIIINRTNELIKNAELVIAHFSTSISYAVMNRKPLIFIYNNDIQRIYRNTLLLNIKSMANYLSAPFINIDVNKINLSDIKVDNLNYSKYINQYICTKDSFLEDNFTTIKNELEIEGDR